MPKFEVLKRTFYAKQFPKGSKDRELLNCHTLTSEYSPSKKYVFYIHKEETERSLAHSLSYTYATKQEAEQHLKMTAGHA